MRIGNGFDVHALVPGRRLVLGGVDIPFERGLDGHSDADVLLHALADAILGALAQGDIGRHFPDSDPRWKGADSRVLLRHVAGLATAAGYRIGIPDRQRRRHRDRAGAEDRAARGGDARQHRRRPGLRRALRQRQGDDDRAPGIHRARRGHRCAGERPARTRRLNRRRRHPRCRRINPPAECAPARSCRRRRAAGGRSRRRAGARCARRWRARAPRRRRLRRCCAQRSRA